MKTITWDKGDGTIAITTIFDETLDSAEHAAELMALGNVPAEYVPIAYDEPLPESEWSIGALRATQGPSGIVVAVDLSLAKEIVKTRLRAERKPLLEALDVQYMRALEAGSSTAAIVTEKQRLRDITLLVDDAESLDDLRAISIQSGR